MQSDAASFRTLLNTKIQSWLEHETVRYQAISSVPEIQAILSHLSEVAHGGKRIRPFLVWSVYKHFNTLATEAELLPLLKAVELFHVFCLIHDDVMDEANTRHGVPTVHAFAEETFYHQTVGLPPKRVADNQAILTGDILFNSVFTLITKFRLSGHPYANEVCDVFSTLIDEVCIGQMLDVHLTSQPMVTTAQIEEKNRLKTAYYTFARPLHMGVLAANKPDLVPFVLAFGEQLGLLFQLQDDLLDVIGDTKNTKKPCFQDVSQNQHTMMTTFIRENGGDAKDLLEDFSGKPLSAEDQMELKAAFIASGAIAHAEELIATYETTALQLITEHNLTPADAALFTGLLNLLTKRTS